MKKSDLFYALGGIGLAAFCAQAQAQQETARVVSTVPVIQQVAVPRQVCNSQPVVMEQPRSGAGAALGAIAGGAAGNAIGGGSGRALATIVGVMGGAILGNSIEGTSSQVQQQTQCATQTFYENRAVAYNVTYEYAGRQYQVQMPHDPGPTLRLQITPVGAGSAPPAGYYPQPQYQQPYSQPYPQQQPMMAPQVIYQAAPPVVVGYARPAPFFYPANLSLSLGYVSGGHRHH
ncbi:MAG TPA: glycine zipper 2TM domain-containing protein [Ramlibacter sp.]|nr:glycine zipper 2TM domain-containing protein [Ramlibacter sp.]